MSRHETHSVKSLSMVKCGLLGCQHHMPTIKGHLMTPWENLRVWEERKTTQLRPPLPVAIWCVMVGLARGHGVATTNLARKLSQSVGIGISLPTIRTSDCRCSHVLACLRNWEVRCLLCLSLCCGCCLPATSVCFPIDQERLNFNL